MAKPAVHYHDVAAFVRRTGAAHEFRFPCGRRYREITPATGRGRRHPYDGGWWVWPQKSDRRGEVTCAACLRWLAMSAEERQLHAAREAATKSQKLTALRARKSAQRDAERADKDRLIAEARAAAPVMLDAYYEARDVAFITDRGEELRLSDVFALAVDAVLRERGGGRGRGRLWITRARRPATAAPNMRRADVVCRFCERVLREDVPMGACPWASDFRHFEPCALRYLAGLGPVPAVPAVHDQCLDCDALMETHRRGETHCSCGEGWPCPLR